MTTAAISRRQRKIVEVTARWARLGRIFHTRKYMNERLLKWTCRAKALAIHREGTPTYKEWRLENGFANRLQGISIAAIESNRGAPDCCAVRTSGTTGSWSGAVIVNR
jgi:hypothetical protein